MGAGKSTASRAIAKRIDNYIDIDIEHVNYMFPNGFAKKSRSDGSIGFKEWAISGETIGLLAKHFFSKGYSVSIHGYANEMLIQNIEKQVIITSKVLLMPSLETVVQRDHERGAHLTMGEVWVRESYENYEKNPPHGLTRLDTSNQAIDETTDQLLQLLGIA